MKRPYDILFEDDSIVIVNKAPGVLSIPDRFEPDRPNLKSFLESRYESILVVHRLDRETSGVICFARTPEAHRDLSQQFEERSVRKFYLALVDGIPAPPEGQIDAGIARHPTQAGKMIASTKGKEALTLYRVIETFRHFALVEAEIKTGRTHQVRVHFQSIGHPLAVDPLYGRRSGFLLSEIKGKDYRQGKFQDEERPLMARTSLHSLRLTLRHPVTGREQSFEAPLPKDFEAVVKQLRKWGK